MKTLVVAADESGASLAAARLSVVLAEGLGAKLRLVHVVPPFAFLAEGATYPRALLADQVAAGERLLQRLRGRLDAKVATEAAVRTGAVAAEIVLAAEEDDATLVAIGSRGRGAIPRAILGSTSDRVVRTCHRPVLVVHDTSRQALFRRVLVGVDGSEHALKAARFAADLARPFSASLVLACVRQVPNLPSDHLSVHLGDVEVAVQAHAEAVLRRAVEQVGEPSAEIRTYRGPVGETLTLAAISEDADALVVGSRGRGGVARALLGSVSGRVLHISERPVIIVG